MSALTLRISPELSNKLEECAKHTHIKKYTLAILAIEAAVNAIEKNGYRLVVPVRFTIQDMPVDKATGEPALSPQALADIARDLLEYSVQQQERGADLGKSSSSTSGYPPHRPALNEAREAPVAAAPPAKKKRAA